MRHRLAASSRVRLTIWIFLGLLLIAVVCALYVIAKPRPASVSSEWVREIQHGAVLGDILALDLELAKYKAINGAYPTTEQGLAALLVVSSPRPSYWKYMQ